MHSHTPCHRSLRRVRPGSEIVQPPIPRRAAALAHTGRRFAQPALHEWRIGPGVTPPTQRDQGIEIPVGAALGALDHMVAVEAAGAPEHGGADNLPFPASQLGRSRPDARRRPPVRRPRRRFPRSPWRRFHPSAAREPVHAWPVIPAIVGDAGRFELRGTSAPPDRPRSFRRAAASAHRAAGASIHRPPSPAISSRG